mgnify:CR=1 FL=1
MRDTGVSPEHQSLRARIADADEAVFQSVAAYHAPMLDRTLPDLSVIASYSRIWLGISAILGIFGGRKERIAAVEGLVAVGLTSFLANLVLKRLIPRQRPTQPVPETRELPDPESSSFPSGHTASGAAYAGAVGRALPRWWAPLNTLAATIGFSRVYTGVHHPSDVVVGWMLGKTVASVVRRSHLVPRLASRLGT